MSVQKGKQGGQTTGFNRSNYQSRPQPSQRDGGFQYTTQSANAGAPNSMRMGMPQAHVQTHAPQVHQQHAAAVAQHAVVVAQQQQQQQQHQQQHQQHGVAVPGGPGGHGPGGHGPGGHGHGGHGGSPASGAAQTQTQPGDMSAHQHALGFSMNAQRQPNATAFYRASRMPGRNVMGMSAQSFVQMSNIQGGMPFHPVILNSSLPQMPYAAPSRPMSNTPYFSPQTQMPIAIAPYPSQRSPFPGCYYTTLPPQSGQPNVQPSQQQSPAQPAIGGPIGLMPSPPVLQNDPNLSAGISQNKQQRRRNAIPIIDPDTNTVVDVYSDTQNSPGSGSSSNRETPRPESHGQITAVVGKNDPSNEPKSVVNGPGPGGSSGPAPALLTSSTSQFHLQEPPSLESWKRPNELEAEEVSQQPIMMYHPTVVAQVPLHSLPSFSETPVVSARSDGPSVDVYKGQRSQQFSPQRKKNDLSNSQFVTSDAVKGKKSGPPQSTAPAQSAAAPHVLTPETSAPLTTAPTTAPAHAASPAAAPATAPAVTAVAAPQIEPVKIAEQPAPVTQSEAKVVEPPMQMSTRSPDAIASSPVEEATAVMPSVTDESPAVAVKHEPSPTPGSVPVPTPSTSPPATTPAAVTASITASSSETSSPTSTTAPPAASAALGTAPTISAAAPSGGSGQAPKGGQGKESKRRNHERNAQHKEEKQAWNERGGKGGKSHTQVVSDPPAAAASATNATTQATPASVPEGKHTGGGRGGGRQANGDNADSHDSGKPSNKKGKKMREAASKSAEKSPDGSEAQAETAPSSSSSATSSGPAPAAASAPTSAPPPADVSPAPVASPDVAAQATSATTSSPAGPVTVAPEETAASPAPGGTAPAPVAPAAAAVAPVGTATKDPVPETAATAPPEAVQARPNALKNSFSAASNPFFTPPFASGPPEQAVVPSFRDNDKEEKFVAARNEENFKVSTGLKNDVNDSIPVRSVPMVMKLNYSVDQWSPMNPTGKKKYGRDFLMQIRFDPKSQKKPDNLPEIDVLRKDDKKGSLSRSMAPFGDFSSGILRSNHQRGVPVQRKSTQGNKPGKTGKPHIIHMSLSLREDVKLHETENAWKPQMMKNEPVLSEEESKTQEIYKTVRGVLNKLTPEKFDRLMGIVQELPIDNKQRMEGVIDLVFNKAVDEPNFSVAYAQMCKLLERKEVPSGNNDGDEKLQFRKTLISRCQQEFENSKAAELNKDEKQREIEKETDPEKKKELMFTFEEEERKFRRKSVGLVRFIGELFKIRMLTQQIMMRCVKNLLYKEDEESLECMCKLLTTIGAILESKGRSTELDSVFGVMHSLADRDKLGKNISSRVRFMLQDVIDLRDNKWISRHGDTAPKTMEQIQRDAERENLESTIALSSQPNTPRKDERAGGRNMGSMDRRGNRGNQGSFGGKDDGWTNVVSTSRPRGGVDIQKLRQNDSSQESFGSHGLFKTWSSGSQVQKEAKKFTTPNKFDILPPDNSLPRPERSNPVVSRGSNSFKRTDSNLSSRNNSQQKLNSQPPSRESSVARGDSQKEKEETKKRTAVSPPAPTQSIEPPTPDLEDVDEIQTACIKIMPEILGNIENHEEAYICVEAAVGKSNYHHFVREIALKSFESKRQGHDAIGLLIVSFMNKNVLDSSQLLSELAVIFRTGIEMILDVPLVWKCLADILVPVIEAGKLTFKDVAQAASVLKEAEPPHPVKFLQHLIQSFVQNKGPNWLRTHWEQHSVNWSHFLAEEDIETFLAENDVSFMEGIVYPSEEGGSGSGLSQKEICDKLTELLHNSKDSFDSIREWITVNVGSGVKDKAFIYSLMTAICKSSLSESGGTWKLNIDGLSEHDKLLASYLDNVPEFEEQCLLAVEALVHSLEHPKGVIHSVFEFLWSNTLVSVEAFQKWQKSGGREGHGVAVSSLTSFFTMVSETEATDDEEP